MVVPGAIKRASTLSLFDSSLEPNVSAIKAGDLHKTGCARAHVDEAVAFLKMLEHNIKTKAAQCGQIFVIVTSLKPFAQF